MGCVPKVNANTIPEGKWTERSLQTPRFTLSRECEQRPRDREREDQGVAHVFLEASRKTCNYGQDNRYHGGGVIRNVSNKPGVSAIDIKKVFI